MSSWLLKTAYFIYIFEKQQVKTVYLCCEPRKANLYKIFTGGRLELESLKKIKSAYKRLRIIGPWHFAEGLLNTQGYSGH